MYELNVGNGVHGLQSPSTWDLMASFSLDRTLLEILDISTSISGAGDLRSLLDLILRKARALTAADAGSVFLVEKAPRPRFGVPPHARPAEALSGDRLWFRRVPERQP